MWKGLLIGNSVWMFADEFDVKKTLKMNECPLKRDQIQVNFIFQPSIFRGYSLVFRGIYVSWGVGGIGVWTLKQTQKGGADLSQLWLYLFVRRNPKMYFLLKHGDIPLLC